MYIVSTYGVFRLCLSQGATGNRTRSAIQSLDQFDAQVHSIFSLRVSFDFLPMFEFQSCLLNSLQAMTRLIILISNLIVESNCLVAKRFSSLHSDSQPDAVACMRTGPEARASRRGLGLGGGLSGGCPNWY